MQKVERVDIRAQIKKHLTKNPQKLQTILHQQVQDPQKYDELDRQLQQLQTIAAAVKATDEQRKNINRQIGPARRNNLDYQGLIDQVANLNKEIKTQSTAQQDLINEIEKLTSAHTQTQSEETTSPKHFQYNATTTATPIDDEMSVYVTTDLGKWQQFVAGSDCSTIYHDARWFDIIASNFSQKSYPIICESADGVVHGIMPLTHLQSRIFGSFTLSMPYVNYGGPLAANGTVEQLLLEHAAEITRTGGGSHMEVRETNLRENWPCSQRKVSMVLELPNDDAALSKQLGSKLRAQVNRATSHNLEVHTGGAELVKDFYDVYSRNMRDLGTPVYTIQFFIDIVNKFPDNVFITTIRKDTKPIAAGFLIGHKDKLEIPWASSLREYNSMGANMLLYRSVLTEAIARGYQFFDFGRSSKDSNTYRFKKQWGAREHPLYWHYWSATGDIPEINPDNPKYKIVIAIWKKIPVWITRFIGPPIASNLP